MPALREGEAMSDSPFTTPEMECRECGRTDEHKVCFPLKVPIPAAPELTIASFAWAVATAFVVLILTGALYAVAHPLALIPNVLLLVAVAYLILGEAWNKRS